MPKRKRPGTAAARAIKTYDRIRDLRKRVDAGTITQNQFHHLLEMETMRNEWASRVQLQSIARDLLPVAATQARKGRSRLLAVVSNILLKSEMTEAGDAIAQEFTKFEIQHHIARPRAPEEFDPELKKEVDKILTETLEAQVGQHADTHTTKH